MGDTWPPVVTQCPATAKVDNFLSTTTVDNQSDSLKRDKDGDGNGKVGKKRWKKIVKGEQ